MHSENMFKAFLIPCVHQTSTPIHSVYLAKVHSFILSIRQSC
jgi:hypothetical protein